MMEYLNRDHAFFKKSPKYFELAVGLALKAALSVGVSFCLSVDLHRILKAAGPEDLRKVIPDCLSRATGPMVNQDSLIRCEEPIDTIKAHELMRLVSFDLEGRTDLPLNYVQTLRVDNVAKEPVFYGTEMNEFILLSLPFKERAELIAEFQKHGIPEDVLDPIDIDSRRLAC